MYGLGCRDEDIDDAFGDQRFDGGLRQLHGEGFQRPSITCVANADYPVWLKGINYLHALDGFVANSRIQEKSGLATKPCNM